MANLPQRPLGFALAKFMGSVPVVPETEYRIAGIYSFGKGLIRRSSISGAETSYRNLTPLEAGQLVMSKLNAWEGALAVVSEEFSGAFVSSEYPVFDINKDAADPRYLKYLVSWPALWEQLTPRGSMVRRKRTTPDTLLATHVPFPSLVEQRRIADKLDAVVGRVDSVVKLRDHLTALHSNLVESLIDSAVASANESARIGEILTFTRTPIEIEEAGIYRTIGIRSFGRGIIHHPDVSPDGLSKLSYFTFPEGALALSNLMAWEGGISVTQAEDAGYIASNRFFFYLPVDDRANTSYLRHFLLSRQGLALVGSACSAGAERNRTLGRKRFEALTIPLPPRPVQDHVASTLDRLSEKLNTAYAEPSLAALRPSILNAAFTGQL